MRLLLFVARVVHLFGLCVFPLFTWQLKRIYIRDFQEAVAWKPKG